MYLFAITFSLCSIYSVHDEVKDKSFELELSWIGDITNGLHKPVPQDIFNDAEQYAKVLNYCITVLLYYCIDTNLITINIDIFSNTKLGKKFNAYSSIM